MKNKSRFLTLFLGVSLLFAGIGSFAAISSSPVKESKADVVPNSTYSNIYSDGFNNTQKFVGYNQVLIVYSGTAHGLSGTDITDVSVLNQISINGVPLNTLCVTPWAGQTWFNIVYPAPVSEGDILEVSDGFTLGDCVMKGFKLRLNSDLKWEYYAEPNSTYSSIYSDSFNNTQKFEGYNQVLVVYTGVAHGLSGEAKTITSPEILGMISINDVPLTSLAIEAWEGQTWINIYYPNTVAIGDVMKVQDGLPVGNAIFNGFILKLNGNSKWENVTLIEDDPLIQNNDYLLFTPSEISIGSNNDWAFYSNNATNEMANLNFGLQFKVNMNDTQLGGYDILKFGSAFAGEDFVQVVINYKVNAYIAKFKNVVLEPPLGTKSIYVTPDVDHIFEFYCLKASESTVCFILGIDGFVVFKTSPQDITGAPDCTYFGMLNGGAAVSSGVSSLTTTTGDALSRFSNRALLMDTIPTSSVEDTGACKGESGYYSKAKAYYNKYLVQSQKETFANSSEYTDERARFAAWGAANGESLSFNLSTGALITSNNSIILTTAIRNDSTVIVIIICSLIATMSILGYVLLRNNKKKE